MGKQDEAAIQWAMANQDDPRAAEILKIASDSIKVSRETPYGALQRPAPIQEEMTMASDTRGKTPFLYGKNSNSPGMALITNALDAATANLAKRGIIGARALDEQILSPLTESVVPEASESLKDTYSRLINEANQSKETLIQDNPISSTAGTLGGLFTPGGVLSRLLSGGNKVAAAAGVTKAKPFLQGLLRGGIANAGYGQIASDFDTSAGDRAKKGAFDAVVGGLTDATLGKVVSSIANRFQGPPKKELLAQIESLYERAKASPNDASIGEELQNALRTFKEQSLNEYQAATGGILDEGTKADSRTTIDLVRGYLEKLGIAPKETSTPVFENYSYRGGGSPAKVDPLLGEVQSAKPGPSLNDFRIKEVNSEIRSPDLSGNLAGTTKGGQRKLLEILSDLEQPANQNVKGLDQFKRTLAEQIDFEKGAQGLHLGGDLNESQIYDALRTDILNSVNKGQGSEARQALEGAFGKSEKDLGLMSDIATGAKSRSFNDLISLDPSSFTQKAIEGIQGKPEYIARLKQVAPPETFSKFQDAVTGNILSKADGTISPNGILNFGKLFKKLSSYSDDTLKELYGPEGAEQIAQVKELLVKNIAHGETGLTLPGEIGETLAGKVSRGVKDKTYGFENWPALLLKAFSQYGLYPSMRAVGKTAEAGQSVLPFLSNIFNLENPYSGSQQ